MKLSDKILEEEKLYSERFAFATERIRSIQEETQDKNCSVNAHGSAFGEYFFRTSSFLLQIGDFYQQKEKKKLTDFSLEKLKAQNTNLCQSYAWKRIL